MSGPYCIECGAELPESAKFCSECGTKIEGSGEEEPTWDVPEDTGEWPYGKKKRRMRQGRKFFGNCPACGNDAMWWRNPLTSSPRAECQVCSALFAGSTEIGKSQYECVEGPDYLLNEVKSRDVWKHIEPDNGGDTEGGEGDRQDDNDLKPSKIIGICPVCGEPPGKGSYFDTEIKCPSCDSHWERDAPSTSWELVESEQAQEWVGETQSQTIWNELEPGDDIDEVIESKRENFDRTVGKLPGLTSTNTTRRNTLIGAGYVLGGLAVLGMLWPSSESNCEEVFSSTVYAGGSEQFDVEPGQYVHISVENNRGFRTIAVVENAEGDLVLSNEPVQDEAAWRLSDPDPDVDVVDETAGTWTVRYQPHDDNSDTSGSVTVNVCWPDED